MLSEKSQRTQNVCWPRLTAKRIAPVISISWASCFPSHTAVLCIKIYDYYCFHLSLFIGCMLSLETLYPRKQEELVGVGVDREKPMSTRSLARSFWASQRTSCKYLSNTDTRNISLSHRHTNHTQQWRTQDCSMGGLGGGTSKAPRTRCRKRRGVGNGEGVLAGSVTVSCLQRKLNAFQAAQCFFSFSI